MTCSRPGGHFEYITSALKKTHEEASKLGGYRGARMRNASSVYALVSISVPTNRPLVSKYIRNTTIKRKKKDTLNLSILTNSSTPTSPHQKSSQTPSGLFFALCQTTNNLASLFCAQNPSEEVTSKGRTRFFPEKKMYEHLRAIQRAQALSSGAC
jgi:hypothetical protein